MDKSEYLLLSGKGDFRPLKERFKQLEGWYCGFGYVFPPKHEALLKELVKTLPGIEIHRAPLSPGQTIEGYQSLYRAKFFRKKLQELTLEIAQQLSLFSLSELSEETIGTLIDHPSKEYLLDLLRERERLEEAIEWAEGIAKAINTKSSAPIDLRSLHEISPAYFAQFPKEKPALLEYVKEGDLTGKKQTFLPKEITALLVGEGGRGKTHFCTLLGLSVASGVPFLGKFFIKTPGGVCLIFGENNQQDIHRLLYKTRTHLHELVAENGRKKEYEKFAIPPHAIERITHFVYPLSVHGINASLVDKIGTPTPFFFSLLDQLKAREPEGGWQLIILDPASRFAGAEAEKDNAVATAFIASLELISQSLIGTPTILLAHHKNKVGIRESSGQADARGASALTDGSRWQANLSKDKEEDEIVNFEITKTNFTQIVQKFQMKKLHDGVLKFHDWIGKK